MPPRAYAITAVAALLACGHRRTPDDTLVMVVETPITTDDPRYTLTNLDSKLGKLIAPGLTTVDTPTAEPELELAARIDQADDRTVVVELRADARFSDGTPVTARDVARTYASVLDPACASPYHDGFVERYRAVEPRGERTVVFHLAQPLAMIRTDLEFGILSFAGVAAGACRPPRVIGAGPYVLRELSSTGAYLDASPFARVPPRLPHVEIRFVKDAAARIVMLVGGTADLIQNAVRADLVDDVAAQPGIQVTSAPSVLLTYLLLDNDDPVLRDVRVRQAIALALDRPAIVAAKLGGRAVLATGMLPPSHWAYAGDVARWTHDRARAAQLLDAAGLVAGPDGVRAHLVYKTSSDAFRVAVAHALAAQLAEVGLAVDVRPLEFATFFADVKAGNYQLATMQSSEIVEPDFYYFYFHSARVPSARDPDAGNRWRYRNPALDRLLEAGRRELDRDRRKAIYAEVQRIVAADVPIVPLWHEHNVVLAGARVHGYVIVPNARYIGLTATTKSR